MAGVACLKLPTKRRHAEIAVGLHAPLVSSADNSNLKVDSVRIADAVGACGWLLTRSGFAA